jgi:hypothetical protein
MINQDKTICPYCGMRMKKWRTPSASTWASEYQFVCFNDACSYFVQGWQWMMEQMQVKASYRHCYNPENDSSGPLPVWSYEALKNEIIEPCPLNSISGACVRFFSQTWTHLNLDLSVSLDYGKRSAERAFRTEEKADDR